MVLHGVPDEQADQAGGDAGHDHGQEDGAAASPPPRRLHQLGQAAPVKPGDGEDGAPCTTTM